MIIDLFEFTMFNVWFFFFFNNFVNLIQMNFSVSARAQYLFYVTIMYLIFHMT